jgi:hypothetical protein
MAFGNLGLFRRLGQSFWLEFGQHVAQVKLTEIGGSGGSSYARMIVSAPTEIKIQREENWIGSEAPVRRVKPRNSQAAIVEVLEKAAVSFRPVSGGSVRMNMTELNMLAIDLIQELQTMGIKIDGKESAR